MTLAHPADRLNQLSPEDLGNQVVPCFLVIQLALSLLEDPTLLLFLVIQVILEFRVFPCRIGQPLLLWPALSEVSPNTCHSCPRG